MVAATSASRRAVCAVAVASDGGGLTDFLPALALMVGGLMAVTWMTVFTAPADGPLAVVFPPGRERMANWSTVLAAGGLVIRERLDGTVLVVQPADAAFAGQVRRLGAWAVIHPRLAGGCGGTAALGRPPVAPARQKNS